VHLQEPGTIRNLGARQFHRRARQQRYYSGEPLDSRYRIKRTRVGRDRFCNSSSALICLYDPSRKGSHCDCGCWFLVTTVYTRDLGLLGVRDPLCRVIPQIYGIIAGSHDPCNSQTCGLTSLIHAFITSSSMFSMIRLGCRGTNLVA